MEKRENKKKKERPKRINRDGEGCTSEHRERRDQKDGKHAANRTKMPTNGHNLVRYGRGFEMGKN